MKNKKIETNKLYTGKTIVEIMGIRKFQDFLISGRIEWVRNDEYGNKLYLLMT